MSSRPSRSRMPVHKWMRCIPRPFGDGVQSLRELALNDHAPVPFGPAACRIGRTDPGGVADVSHLACGIRRPDMDAGLSQATQCIRVSAHVQLVVEEQPYISSLFRASN